MAETLDIDTLDNFKSWWTFVGDLKADSIVECPTCKEQSCISDWRESEVACEDCGSHDAIVCPKCDDYFDHVYSNRHPIKVVS